MAKVKSDGKLNRAIAAWKQGQYRGAVMAGEIVAQRARRDAPRDTGRLKRSIAVGRPYIAGLNRVAVNVGTNVVYGAIQEFGGRIVPKQAKMLSIPIGTRRGSPRQYPDLVLIKSRSGSVLLIDAEGVPQYVLVHHVDIPAHPYLRPAAKRSKDEVALLMLRSILGAMRGVK